MENKETPYTFFLYHSPKTRFYNIVEVGATIQSNLMIGFEEVGKAKTLEECRKMAESGIILNEFLCDF